MFEPENQIELRCHGWSEELMTNPVLAAFGRPFRLEDIFRGAPPSMIGPVHRLAAIMDHASPLWPGPVCPARSDRGMREWRSVCPRSGAMAASGS